jgi:hypothetical protein
MRSDTGAARSMSGDRQNTVAGNRRASRCVQANRAVEIAALAILISAVTAHAVLADENGPIAHSQVDPSWDAVFDRQNGWTGGDGAGTVDLGDRRMLWLFGDTWIGTIRDGKRMPGARMVNNSIAVHRIDKSKPWLPPKPADVRFLWGPNDGDGKPTAWAVPSGQSGQTSDTEWLWPAGGGAVVAGPGNFRRLIVFFFRVRRTPDDRGVWSFLVIGSAMGLVDNVAEPAPRWRLRLLNMPSDASPHDKTHPGQANRLWGMAVQSFPISNEKSPAILVFGTRSTGAFNFLNVAATSDETIGRFDAWHSYAGAKGWVRGLDAARSVADGMVSEFSVEPMTIANQAEWVLVQSEPFLGKRIFVRTAPSPTGPWSVTQKIFTVPDVERSKSYFTYAAKGHAALSRPGELLVTYLVNSNRFADLMTDTAIYRPRFIRVPSSALLPR